MPTQELSDVHVEGVGEIQRQLLLGHAALDPQIPHPSAHGVPNPCPNRAGSHMAEK
ncbi:hypothetical protein DSM43276_02643 [Mycobacteroides salmoniphilum]|nr:hypothetical protein DSM43276_02643 [Mycobacteroides salmoniphilum]